MKLFFRKKLDLKIQEKRGDVERLLRVRSMMPEEELFSELESSIQGFSSEEAERLLETYGPNEIKTDKEDTTLHRLREAIINPFNIILLLIAAISYVTDVIFAAKPDYLTIIIILVLVALASAVAFVQSRRSSAAAASLLEMISNESDVLRDGRFRSIPMHEVVPGDIIKLSAGDMLPADVRFISAKDTFVAQAALTGESNPVEKFSRTAESDSLSLTDLPNIGFMGSNIVSGSAQAIVLATGSDTYFGLMAKSLTGDKAQSSFERGVGQVSRLLIRMMLIMIPAVFLLNGLTKGDWASALFFAISIAVGLTPEMLPVIMTSTLARGAVTMSKHKVVVRTLGSIQSFGEMDVLCTDKTGTLTEDKIVLERYMNLHGEDDTRVLRHAYLNSSYQTGLKNLIDLAIINRAGKYGLDSLQAKYRRVDEIPFDFSRRRMSVVLVDETGKRQLITKGAVEEILSISSFVEFNGSVYPMDEASRKEAMQVYEKHNREGLRMIAVAQKNEVPDSNTFSVSDEKDMVLIGFVGFLDPPKESASAAIKALKDHGVRTVVLTGDSEGVAIKVCEKVGVSTKLHYTGSDVEAMDDEALAEAVKHCDLFAKLSPAQKVRVVQTFRHNGHTVGFLGDGINDAPAIQQADVGISVDTAVDIAKETADIILMEKDLMVLEEGILEGRKTFGNIIKYIKMAVSGNFGNMISVLVASIFLPFLPMLPVQILTQNLLCDFSQLGMPFDHVDQSYLKKPRKWETGSIKSFMAFMGPLSSIFDLLCFAILWWIFKANTAETAAIFRAGWFIFGTVSQILVIHIIRTGRIPFLQSKPSTPLLWSTGLIAVLALVVAFSKLAIGIDLLPLPLSFAPWLILLLAAYFVSSQLIKRIYIRRFGEWL